MAVGELDWKLLLRKSPHFPLISKGERRKRTLIIYKSYHCMFQSIDKFFIDIETPTLLRKTLLEACLNMPYIEKCLLIVINSRCMETAIMLPRCMDFLICPRYMVEVIHDDILNTWRKP